MIYKPTDPAIRALAKKMEIEPDLVADALNAIDFKFTGSAEQAEEAPPSVIIRKIKFLSPRNRALFFPRLNQFLAEQLEYYECIRRGL